MTPSRSPTDLVLVSGVVDLERRRARIGDADVRLTTTEVGLLTYLAANPGRAVSRDELLKEVWGYADGAVSRTVDVTVRRLRAKIEPDPAFPVHLLSVHGVGYTFVPAPENAEPPPAPAPRTVDHPAFVPQARGTIADPPAAVEHGPDAPIGRAAARAAVWEAIARGARPVTVTGPAGVGKTRLARALVDEVRAVGRKGWLVDLVAVESTEALAIATAAALGLDGASDEAIGGALATSGDALLALDNFEQLDEVCAARVARWTAAAPAVAVVVTSRRPLGLPGEEVLRLDPLSTADAVALFRRRARRVRPDVRLDDEPLLRELVTRLDGLPLAIELAAARVRALSVEELSARLALPLLKDPQPASPRRATLARALDGSWGLLREEARRALVALSVLPGRTFVGVAERLLERVGIDDPLGALETLVDHSLVRVEEGPPGTDAARLAPFVVVTEYAAARAAEVEVPGAVEAWGGALADVLAGWAAEVPKPEGRRAIARILAETDNVVAFAKRHMATWPALGIRIIEAHYDGVNAVGGHPAEFVLLAAAIEGARALGDDGKLAAMLSRRIYAWARLSRVAEAEADADAVARLAAGNPALALEGLRAELGRAAALRRAGRPRDALAALDAVVFPPDAAPTFVIYRANERGLLLTRLGDVAAAAEAFERAYALSEAVGDERRMEAAFDHLAMARVEEGRGAEIEALVRSAVERRRAAGVEAMLSPLWYVLGVIALEAGRLDEARAAFRAEQASGEARGRASAVFAGHFNLALVALRAGDPAAALAELRTAQAGYQRIDARRLPAVLPPAVAIATVAAGERPAPVDLDAHPADGPIDDALLELGSAVIARAHGEPGAAERLAAAVATPARDTSVDLRELCRAATGLFP